MKVNLQFTLPETGERRSAFVELSRVPSVGEFVNTNGLRHFGCFSHEMEVTKVLHWREPDEEARSPLHPRDFVWADVTVKVPSPDNL